MESIESNTFNPVKFSIAENEYLLANLGKPPVVALRGLPAEVNMAAVRPIMEQVYGLIELAKHSGQEWAGVEAMKAGISIYLEQAAKWKADKKRFRGAPRFPTMSIYDHRKRPHRQGPGSDAQEVQTYFDAAGNRHKFEVDLVPSGIPDWNAPGQEAPNPGGLVVEEKRIVCTVCTHTESFNPESRASQNAARARMSKHLRTSTDEVDRHRELHTLEFGG